MQDAGPLLFTRNAVCSPRPDPPAPTPGQSIDLQLTPLHRAFRSARRTSRIHYSHADCWIPAAFISEPATSETASTSSAKRYNEPKGNSPFSSPTVRRRSERMAKTKIRENMNSSDPGTFELMQSDHLASTDAFSASPPRPLELHSAQQSHGELRQETVDPFVANANVLQRTLRSRRNPHQLAGLRLMQKTPEHHSYKLVAQTAFFEHCSPCARRCSLWAQRMLSN